MVDTWLCSCKQSVNPGDYVQPKMVCPQTFSLAGIKIASDQHPPSCPTPQKMANWLLDGPKILKSFSSGTLSCGVRLNMFKEIFMLVFKDLPPQKWNKIDIFKNLQHVSFFYIKYMHRFKDTKIHLFFWSGGKQFGLGLPPSSTSNTSLGCHNQ